jgi:hypothetical protein
MYELRIGVTWPATRRDGKQFNLYMMKGTYILLLNILDYVVRNKKEILGVGAS